VACNRLHTINQRCARWLLMTHDRVGGGDSFDLTQEFLSYMLGVRREGVSGASHALQHLGIISYRRGHISVLDRPALERAACECYGATRADYARLFSGRVRASR
jgi:CRP-like cAMP-binding protein